MTGDALGTPGFPPGNTEGRPPVLPGSRAPRSYVIVGTGAMGIYYGGLLHNAGFAVTFLSTRQAKPGVSPGGRSFTIESTSGAIIIANPRIPSNSDDAGRHDVAIITLKTTQNHLLPGILPRILKPGGSVVFLQNGIGVEEESLGVISPEQILIGMCYIGVEKIGPDRIRHIDGGRIVLGELNQRSEVRDRKSDPREGDRTPHSAAVGGRAGDNFSQRLLDIALEFQHAGIPVQPTDAVLRAQWQKLLWNIPFNGLSVVLDMQPHEIVGERDEETKRRSDKAKDAGPASNRQSSIVNPQSPLVLVETIMREILAAARATGHPLPESLIPQLINYTRGLPPFRTSMRQDYDRGRELELKTMYEHPIRLALERGLEMPATEALWRQLQRRLPPGAPVS